MNSDHPAAANGFVLAADEGPAFWFLNTLTINKVGRRDGQGHLAIVDHRVPARFSPPPHVHQDSDEAFFILDGQFTGFCGDRSWEAGPGSLVFLPHGIPHGFRVSATSPGRALLILSPGGFDEFVAALGKPAEHLHLPTPIAPDPAQVTRIAAAHGIQILPPP